MEIEATVKVSILNNGKNLNADEVGRHRERHERLQKKKKQPDAYTSERMNTYKNILQLLLNR